LQVLDYVCLAIFEIVGDVRTHHAHLAVALTVRARLALVWHQRDVSANLGTHCSLLSTLSPL
jgi:hypothetical protein